MIRTEAESLDLLTFDRSPVGGAAVFNAKLGAGEVTPAREGEPADSLGHPILYVEKPVMKVGAVAHTPDGDMRVTAEACDLVARCTNEWIADGGRPFVPKGHRDFHENENLGWLKGMRFDGEQLWARHALIGADAHLAAARNDSSVMLRWGFKHGGKTYPLIVEHNAILPDARFKGLGDFVALSRAGAEPERIPVYELAFDRGDAGGHWVTIEGRHVLIPDTAGVVPSRVKATPGSLKRFTRGNLEKAITDHHRDKSGDSGEYTPAMERELTQAAGDAEDAFRFHKKLPTEIKDAVGENPALRRVFTVTDDVRKAHGADAFSSLGDRYIDIAEARAGSPLRQAKAFARQSGDPEAAFMAHVHDNLPSGGTKALEPVKAGGLRVGDEFTIGGKAHRVAEDEHGFRVLRSHEYGKGDVPLDAVEHVPVDKGSFRRSTVSRRLAPSDGIPFSRRLIPPVSLRLAMGRGNGGVTTGSFGDSGYFREVAGETIFFHGTPGHGFTDSQSRVGKILTRSGTKTITIEPDKGGHRVTESGPGKGNHQESWHPTSDSAARDANSRVAHAETSARASGDHIATLKRDPGPPPAGHQRYGVRQIPGEGGGTAAYLIDHKSGDVMRPAGSIVRHYEDAADAHAVAARMNAREAGAPAVSKRLAEAAGPVEANPVTPSGEQAKDHLQIARDAVLKAHQADPVNKAGSPYDLKGRRLHLAQIRPHMEAAGLSRAEQDAALLKLQDRGEAVLFHDDQAPHYKTQAQRDADLTTPGGSKRGVLYWTGWEKASAEPVSARLQSAAAAPGEPAKSAGHVGFYRDNINRPRELYTDEAGNLHSASADKPVNPATGRRDGRHEAGPAGAGQAAAHLMSGAKVIRRQGGPSVFDSRTTQRVQAVSKRLEAAAVESGAGKGENRGMETPKEPYADSPLAPMVKELHAAAEADRANPHDYGEGGAVRRHTNAAGALADKIAEKAKEYTGGKEWADKVGVWYDGRNAVSKAMDDLGLSHKGLSDYHQGGFAEDARRVQSGLKENLKDHAAGWVKAIENEADPTFRREYSLSGDIPHNVMRHAFGKDPWGKPSYTMEKGPYDPQGQDIGIGPNENETGKHFWKLRATRSRMETFAKAYKEGKQAGHRGSALSKHVIGQLPPL